jgi:hypothetical protein
VVVGGTVISPTFFSGTPSTLFVCSAAVGV